VDPLPPRAALEPLFACARAADARHTFGRRHVGIAWRRACAAWREYSAREYRAREQDARSLVRATLPGAAVVRATGRVAADRTLAAPAAVDRFHGLLAALGWRARVVPPGELLACRSKGRPAVPCVRRLACGALAARAAGAAAEMRAGNSGSAWRRKDARRGAGGGRRQAAGTRGWWRWPAAMSRVATKMTRGALARPGALLESLARRSSGVGRTLGSQLAFMKRATLP
jgi:hypothetical protein